MDNLRRLGPEYEQMADIIEQNPDVLVLWATDSNVGPSGFLTSLTISTEQVISTVTLDTYMDIATQQYPSQFKVVEREKIDLGPHQAGKLVIDFEVNSVNGKQLSYVVKYGTTIWVITYSTGLTEYEDRVPEIDKIINSFRIKSN